VPTALIDDGMFKFDRVGTTNTARLGTYNDIEINQIRVMIMKLKGSKADVSGEKCTETGMNGSTQSGEKLILSKSLCISGLDLLPLLDFMGQKLPPTPKLQQLHQKPSNFHASHIDGLLKPVVYLNLIPF
jgi:hypothetical protein